jgi:hypothetical protein
MGDDRRKGTKEKRTQSTDLHGDCGQHSRRDGRGDLAGLALLIEALPSSSVTL